jgi:hypothetical protein
VSPNNATSQIRSAHRGRYERWWKNTVIYCLDVETYLDTDGDGVGDFGGLLNRLDRASSYRRHIDQHTTWLTRYAELGFDRIYLHHVGQEQSEFIRAFGERVIPVFNS